MTPQEVLDAIAAALRQSVEFSEGDIITHELDASGPDSRLQQPIVALDVVSNIRNDAHNTDRVGVTTDAQGNQTGRIFEAVFEMDVQADIYVAVGNEKLNATELGGDFAGALLQHDTGAVGLPLPDGDGGTVTDVTQFRVGTGQRQDDLAGPGVRRWQHDLFVRFTDRVTTTDDHVKAVETPATGSGVGGDSVAIELTTS